MLNDILHLQIKLKRDAFRISPEKLANLLDVTIGSYFDLEASPTEWRMVLPLYKLRFLISLLEIDTTPITGSASVHFDGILDASTLIRSLREKKKISKEVFADRVGFYPVFSDIVEEHPLGLELYPLEVAMLV